jgi:sortase (surface protein transpeptidase)
MTTLTPRTGLSRAAALVLTLAFAIGWAQSSLVLAHTTTEAGGVADGAAVLAEPRLDAAAGSRFGWLFDLHERREDLRPAPVFESKAVAQPIQSKPKAAAAQAAQPTYAGRNHFWIPSLGMSYRVYPYDCTRTRDPDNYMYRWGCAGQNNVYILGHAYSVMKPLHDLYVSGRLRKGMVAIYADAHGRVHWYRVTTWRVVDPTEVDWAIARQPVPSMTLQTCVGRDGHLRLNVRLVAFK